ncbi:Sulfurtransferase TusD [Buchnera aphidicola (Eriosoma grossulariae)]|uniref:sulfurtransferase complex subunit TusD n=1 Tax=Buchnera aphidicola TaxID=9 RepID=UPI003463CECF
MTYTIIVTGSPYDSQNSRSALFFSRALLSLKHRIDLIFFYGNGVLNSNLMLSVANNEVNLFDEWKKFYQDFQVPLYICINSSLKRGLLETEKSSLLGFKKSNIGDFFKLSGFLELLNSIQKTDRFIQF